MECSSFLTEVHLKCMTFLSLWNAETCQEHKNEGNFYIVMMQTWNVATNATINNLFWRLLTCAQQLQWQFAWLCVSRGSLHSAFFLIKMFFQCSTSFQSFASRHVFKSFHVSSSQTQCHQASLPGKIKKSHTNMLHKVESCKPDCSLHFINIISDPVTGPGKCWQTMTWVTLTMEISLLMLVLVMMLHNMLTMTLTKSVDVLDLLPVGTQDTATKKHNKICSFLLNCYA